MQSLETGNIVYIIRRKPKHNTTQDVLDITMLKTNTNNVKRHDPPKKQLEEKTNRTDL